MAIRPIIIAPAKVLQSLAEPVTQINDAIITLLSDMADTMYAANGIGLAANQLGELVRVIVIDIPIYEDEASEDEAGEEDDGYEDEDSEGEAGEGEQKPRPEKPPDKPSDNLADNLADNLPVAELSQRQAKSATGLLKMINPEIFWRSEAMCSDSEGCLSFPGETADVKRHVSIKLKYQDITGKAHQITANGLLGVCIQHEIDHLDGIVFVDRISRLKRNLIMRRMAKQAAKNDI